MVMGDASGPNPQTAPRLSLFGTASPEPDAGLKARWITLHPYAAFYAGLGDFQLWRFRSAAGQFVGGFASAHRFERADITPDANGVEAVAGAETQIVAHCNGDHPDAMDAIARAWGGVGPGWRMVACDVDGCDLAQDENVVRVAWSGPVANTASIRSELVRLAAAARNSGTDAGPG